MNDEDRPASAAPIQSAPPRPVVEPPKRWRLSLVWIVPLVAALIGLSLGVQALMKKGPVITVSFSTAEGIEPGKTKVKYKNVDIGDVRAVTLSDDRSRVVVQIELAKQAKGFAVADSRFWVVRPRMAGTGISGLSTLLSGAYIGVDGGRSEESRDDFVGLEEPPAVTSDVPGHRYKLIAEDIGSLDAGSPVYFRRLEVGHIESFSLEPDGRHITMGVFIRSPYDRFVNKDTRFWQASGIDVRVDANGLKVETQSLSSILMGGVAFETPAGSNETEMAENGTGFDLAGDHGAAMKEPDGQPVTLLMHFQQSVRGLTVGAPIDFRGVEIGHIRSVGVTFDKAAGQFIAPVTADIFPDRLRPASERGAEVSDKERIAILTKLIKSGLRAQLRTSSLITGQLYVALDFFPNAVPVNFNPAADPPEIPTTEGDMEELQHQVQSILAKLDKVPFDKLGDDAHRVLTRLDTSLQHIDQMVAHADGTLLPQLGDSLKEMQRTLETTQSTLSPDAPLQQDMRETLRGVTQATRSLKSLADTIERRPESLLRGKNGADK